ncbi:DsbA family protein [Ornithinimicrobium sediminis]|uniref:DsbA family protein n=1 Tax=Ornithinimicrobium sediminis TaxID=2904603 RepID=UPI001E366D3C|nr:thioredoxin domain-containing protein [Ornithinimicrobium sediminis]MCE0487574.1 DsbA family protein [Ornithinimicrobium sediminis]
MPRPPAPKATPAKPSGPPLGLIGAVTAVLVALVAVLVYLAVRGDGLEAEGAANTLPAGGGIVVNPDAPEDATTVHVYEDFQCPFCGVLARSIGEGLTEKAEAGEIRLTHTIMSFLDGNLGNDTSSRAANAALCAGDAGVFSEWHATAYESQPTEGAGWTDADLVGFAEQVGLEGEDLSGFETCVAEGTYLDYVTDMQEAANREGVASTPTLVVNGETLSREELSLLQSDPGALDSVLAAHE